ncbi:MAG: response regulator transcription factor [Anaerolineales bacterium]|jgi:DNA-binding NarL/FixJ family response regulator|nr:MAG: response regulator transcription factor [Anaerolineales bacterium]
MLYSPRSNNKGGDIMEKFSIIIVDDHPLFREGVRSVIDAEDDLNVLAEGTSGDQALQLVRELRPRVALIDINMPNMNGMQVTRQIKAERLDTSIVLLTAYDDVEQVLHAFSAGASAYCSKDVEAGKLVDIVRQVARGFYIVGDQVFDAEGLEEWLSRGVEAVRRPHLDGDIEAFTPLSPREMEILQYVTRGMSNKEIAAKLGISHQTVKNHMTAILHKLDVEDRTQAAVYALRHGWVRLQDTRK